MRKYFFAVILGAVSTSVSAQTSGLGPNCDKCLQEINCGAKLALENLKQYSCSEILNRGLNNGLSEEVKSWKETAINTCGHEYSQYGDAGFGVDAAVAYVWDRCSAQDGGISGSELEQLIRETNRTILYEAVAICQAVGSCVVSSADYYVHVCGMTPGEWGLNSSAGKCPDGGTTAGVGTCYDGLLCCAMDAGTFSDSTGSGTLTGQCGYSFDSEEEWMNYIYCL